MVALQCFEMLNNARWRGKKDFLTACYLGVNWIDNLIIINWKALIYSDSWDMLSCITSVSKQNYHSQHRAIFFLTERLRFKIEGV